MTLSWAAKGTSCLDAANLSYMLYKCYLRTVYGNVFEFPFEAYVRASCRASDHRICLRQAILHPPSVRAPLWLPTSGEILQ